GDVAFGILCRAPITAIPGYWYYSQVWPCSISADRQSGGILIPPPSFSGGVRSGWCPRILGMDRYCSWSQDGFSGETLKKVTNLKRVHHGSGHSGSWRGSCFTRSGF